MRFDQLRNEINKNLASQGWTEVLDLVYQYETFLSSYQQHFMVWKIISLLGMRDIHGAASIFDEALKSGYWWAPNLINEIPAWTNLCEMPENFHLKQLNTKLYLESQKNSRSELEIFMPEKLSKKQFPVLLCLHGRMSTSELFKEKWNIVLNFGWATALAQSSQINAYKSYHWDDFSIAEEEISSHINELRKLHDLESNSIFIVGFSQGADLAFRIANNLNYPISGLLAVAPAFSQTTAFPILKNKPFVILTGERDERWYPLALSIHEKIIEAGAPVYFSSQKDCGHEFPVNFEEQIPKILSFLKEYQ
jgi:predicted esterase